MSIKTYKQYFPVDIECKLISGLKDANIERLYEMTDYQHEQRKDDFRPMHLSVLDFDETEDLGDFVGGVLLEDYTYREFVKEQQHYMRILLGKLPNWHLVRVSAYTTGLLVDFYTFKPDGSPTDDWLQLNVEIPRRLKLSVTIGADAVHPEEQYIILMETDSEGTKRVHLEYFFDGRKQYDSIVMEDEKGDYELITEA